MHRLLVLCLALAACGDTVISTESYDQTCEVDADCTPVYVGDVCDCSCEVDAIRSTEQTLWAMERSRKQNRCDPLPACAPCGTVTVACDAGTCVASVEGGGGDTDTDAPDDTDAGE